MSTERDQAQDEMIRRNSERISRNEEAIRRQTEALEQIRDHYYPPPEKPWKKALAFLLKAVCVVVAYAGVVQTADWYWNTRKSEAMAERCADVAHRLFFCEGDAIGATRFLEKAVELDADTLKYRLFLAYVKNMTAVTGLFEVGRPLTAAERSRVDAALAEASFLLETAPEEPLSHVLAAQAYILRGEKDAAIAAVDRAIALAPEKAQLHVCACLVYYTAGDFAGARRQVEEACRLSPRPPLVSFWKGYLALTVDHDIAAARGFSEELVRLAPRLAIAHVLLGQVLLAEKDPDCKAADREFRRALELDPLFHSAALGLGEIAMRAGNRPVARLWCDRVLRQDPNCMKALETRARLNVLEADWTAAVADWTAAIALSPFRADLYRERAAVYARLNDERHAAADRQTAAALGEKAL